MPDGSNDKGFAMTSSVTCMLLAGFALFNCEKIDEIVKDIAKLSGYFGNSSQSLSKMAQEYAKKPFDRAVYLAGGAFKGLAHEGSLKMMELSGGAVNTSFDSATGFRHGPKSVIKDNTLTLHFISNDSFTSQYDIDLSKEVFREKNKNAVVAVCPDDVKGIEADDVITVNAGGYGFAADLCIGISGLVFFQMLAMHKSLELGITTDNPSPGGQVNRVVKGVIIYPYA
jgi:tagatose-6-phosphate ketose/aldose isomerase